MVKSMKSRSKAMQDVENENHQQRTAREGKPYSLYGRVKRYAVIFLGWKRKPHQQLQFQRMAPKYRAAILIKRWVFCSSPQH